MPGQTVQTHIRLLLEEQSDQSFRCLCVEALGRSFHEHSDQIARGSSLGARYRVDFVVLGACYIADLVSVLPSYPSPSAMS